MAGAGEFQRIERLTPLVDVLARIDALVKPVAPRLISLDAALGCVLAQDAVATRGLPAEARALCDGYAVRAEEIADAGSYAPVPFAAPPARVNVGDVLPDGTDAVAPLETIVAHGGRFEAIAPVMAGEGVLPANADVDVGGLMHQAGRSLYGVAIAVLKAAGMDSVVVRVPRVRMVKARADRDSKLDPAIELIGRAIAPEGRVIQHEGESLADSLACGDCDAVVVIGGTGSGDNDDSVRALGRLGRVEVHGIALSPGETTGFGFVGQRPVLLLPGRIDAALAAWLAIGRTTLAKLSGNKCFDDLTISVPLRRKVVSALGLAAIVPVQLRAGHAEPMAAGYWPLSAMARADGWILVPADSEGYPAEAAVMVRPWP